jgi:hypothetical protein
MAKRYQRDTRFPLVPLADIRTSLDHGVVVRTLANQAFALGMEEGTKLDLVSCNNLGTGGHDIWVEVCTELLDPPPAQWEELQESRAVYMGRFEVPRE